MALRPAPHPRDDTADTTPLHAPSSQPPPTDQQYGYLSPVFVSGPTAPPAAPPIERERRRYSATPSYSRPYADQDSSYWGAPDSWSRPANSNASPPASDEVSYTSSASPPPFLRSHAAPPPPPPDGDEAPYTSSASPPPSSGSGDVTPTDAGHSKSGGSMWNDDIIIAEPAEKIGRKKSAQPARESRRRMEEQEARLRREEREARLRKEREEERWALELREREKERWALQLRKREKSERTKKVKGEPPRKEHGRRPLREPQREDEVAGRRDAERARQRLATASYRGPAPGMVNAAAPAKAGGMDEAVDDLIAVWTTAYD